MESRKFQTLLRILKKEGVLLEADPQLPSLATVIAGAPVRGSWWSHSKGKSIYKFSSALHEHPEVAVVKLLSGKVTFIHRNLWSALIAIATSQEKWQKTSLSNNALWLFRKIETNGMMRTDQLSLPKENKSIGDLSREIEKRLLVYGSSVHTETGTHAKRLESWAFFTDDKKLKLKAVELEEAKNLFVTIVQSLNQRFQSRALLPWEKGSW